MYKSVPVIYFQCNFTICRWLHLRKLITKLLLKYDHVKFHLSKVLQNNSFPLSWKAVIIPLYYINNFSQNQIWKTSKFSWVLLYSLAFFLNGPSALSHHVLLENLRDQICPEKLANSQTVKLTLLTLML